MQINDMSGGEIGTAPPWMRQKPMMIPNSAPQPYTTQPTQVGGDPIGYGGTAPMVATDPATDPYAPVASASFTPQTTGYDQPNRTGDGTPPIYGPPQINPGPTAIGQGVSSPDFSAPATPQYTPTPQYAREAPTGLAPWQMSASGGGSAPGANPYSVETGDLPPINFDYSGEAQRGADAAYKSATQFYDKDFTRDNSSLENKLVNQGFSPGTEAFTNEMEKQKRGQNAMRENAAYTAQGVGFDQAGQLLSRALASRAAIYGERSDTANRALAARGQDRGVDSAGLSASASMANANSAAEANRYSTDASTTVALRRLGLDSSNSDVNNLISLINSSRGGVNMPNFGAPNPLDVTGANSIASGNANAASNRSATDRATLAQLGGAALGAYFRS